VSRSHALRSLALVFVLGLGGCVAWQPVTTPVADLLVTEAPERIRITTADGTVQTLHAPAIRAGALVATLGPGAALIEDVTLLEVERKSIARTIALVAPAALVVALVAWEACRC